MTITKWVPMDFGGKSIFKKRENLYSQKKNFTNRIYYHYIDKRFNSRFK